MSAMGRDRIDALLLAAWEDLTLTSGLLQIGAEQGSLPEPDRHCIPEHHKGLGVSCDAPGAGCDVCVASHPICQSLLLTMA